MRALVCAPDGRSADLGEIELRAGEVIDVGLVDFTTGRLAVRVVGAPLGAAATVSVVDNSRTTRRAACDADGRASFELPVGAYGLRAEALGRSTGAWRCAWVGAASSVEIVLSLGELATLAGTVRGPGDPLRDVVARAQRMRPPSNASSAAATDADGRFEFPPLEPGLYRYLVGASLMGEVELAQGERRELDVTLGRPETRVVVEHDGAQATWIERLSVASTSAREWWPARGREPGVFTAELPEGPLLFELEVSALVRSQQVFVPGPAAIGAEYVLTLPSTGIELRLSGAAAHRPNPRAALTSLGGVAVQSSSGGILQLLMEPCDTYAAEGVRVVRIPYLAPGSVVALQGAGGDGQARTQRVTVGAEGWTHVDWK